MGRFERDQQMDMIRHTSDSLWDAAQSAHGAAQVFVKPFPPLLPDEGSPVLGGKDKVIKEAGVR